MKYMLLRVGIDKGNGGCLSPIFDDGSFEYIPIPERCATSENRIYKHLKGRYHYSIRNFVPERLHYSVPHLDPEFETFTYGDPTQNKRGQLARLNQGDLLVFYAGLDSENRIDIPRLFIIGYLTVSQVYDFARIPEYEYNRILQKVDNNAHAKRRYQEEDLVIVEGNPEKSRLFDKALPLGDSEDKTMKDIKPLLGWRKRCSLRRAIGHWVEEENTLRFREWLDSGPPALVEDDTNLFSYVLASDTGFAPNVTGGYCTLACCKPVIRRVAKEGDWVVGTYPKRLGWNRLGYVMRVGEVLSFEEFFNDPRFKSKKPPEDPDGDNIYYREGRRYGQLENRHHDEKAIKSDTKEDRVLIGSLFWYFGKNGAEIPAKLSDFIKQGPGHKKIEKSELIKDFISWLSSNYRIGVAGDPRDKSMEEPGQEIC